MIEQFQLFSYLLLRAIFRAFGYLYPFYSGGGKFTQLSLFTYASPHQPCQVNLKNGRKLWLNPAEYFGRTVYYFLDYDRKITFFCRKLLEKGDILLDIGANIGVISLNCADILQAGGQIHLFEPNPELIEYLQKTIATNEIDNLILHPYGLSDQDGIAELHIDDGNISRASISRIIPGEKICIEIKDSAQVFTQILKNSDAPYLIKIDVEGYEPVILNRVKDILGSRKPKAIIFEFNEDVKNSEEASIFHLLKQMDMVIYFIRRGALIRPSLELLPEKFDIPPSTDYIAIDQSNINWLSKRVKIKC
ncbi:FkbM family methyltransferase [Fischerella sp. PCC 9605]|uniref:FkbM family methyltransferase n=1 Tax=Fischerella sp. PCC 9605 TaxID=1173024 RepID=UPI000478BFA4|nr:FkbM family methyltransferase [Fischerella sp. PCC 9605]